MLIERLAIAVASLALTIQADAAPPEWITPSDKADGMFDIRWPGGPLMDLFEGLDEIDGASFIVPQSAKRIGLEPFNIDDAWPREVMEIVGLLRPGIEARFIGGTASIMNDEGIVSDINRGSNFVISIADYLVDRASEENERFDIDFEGGSLKAYARAIHRSSGEKKIVVMQAVEDLPVPAIELTNVTIEDAARLLVNMLGVRLEFVEDIAVIQMDAGAVSTRQTRSIDSNAWAVAELMLSGMSEDDLLSAVDSAIGLAGGETRISFHPQTGVLMARGPQDELLMIDEVIGRVAQSAEARAVQADMEHALRAQRAQVEYIEIEMQQAINFERHSREIVADAKKLREQDHMSESELSQHRLQLNNATAEVGKKRAQLNMAMQELEALEKRLEAMR